MDIQLFWKRARAQIREKRRTQAEVAQACGLPYSTFRRWITKNIIPTLDVASAMSDYLEISLEYLVNGEETNVPIKNQRCPYFIHGAN